MKVKTSSKFKLFFYHCNWIYLSTILYWNVARRLADNKLMLLFNIVLLYYCKLWA